MHHHSHLNSAISIVEQYNGEEPFAAFLKKYFAANKKFGSRDRKQVSHVCYCYFRTGKMGRQLSVEERMLAGLFLCTHSRSELIESLQPGFAGKETLSVEDKFSLLKGHSMNEVFPWKEELSTGIDHLLFTPSFFLQPDLFLRLRPGHEEAVKRKLTAASIQFDLIDDNCAALPNGSKVDAIIELNKEAIVQDYNSQKVITLLQSRIPSLSAGKSNPESKNKLWDCCAASGGKSIMVHDLFPQFDLTVSDIRESILANLKKRFAIAGIANYKSFVADLSGAKTGIPQSTFDIVLADVPCTGSGTWSRTPEQLFYFDESRIETYAVLQKKIVTSVIPPIKPGGYLLYSTCSVFSKENEEAIDYIKRNFHLDLIKMEVLKGYRQKADTMFAALLQKPL